MRACFDKRGCIKKPCWTLKDNPIPVHNPAPCPRRLPHREVVARFRKGDGRAAGGVRPGLEALPRGAGLPVGQLVPGHCCVTVRRQVDAHEAVVHVPGHKRANLCVAKEGGSNHTEVGGGGTMKPRPGAA